MVLLWRFRQAAHYAVERATDVALPDTDLLAVFGPRLDLPLAGILHVFDEPLFLALSAFEQAQEAAFMFRVSNPTEAVPQIPVAAVTQDRRT